MILTKPDHSTWYSLPWEIRNMILEAILQTGCRVGHLAAVSREWQTMIEPRNFARIKLTAPRVAEFGSMIYRNRALVRYIWLCVELEEYDCTQCVPGYIDDTWPSNTDDILIATVFRDLFSALSTWEPNGTLVLDISVYSPSDVKHCFKYLTFRPDPPADQCELDLYTEQQSIQAKPDDPQHGWIAGGRNSTLSMEAIYKVFDEIMGQAWSYEDEQGNKPWQQLPLVRVVTAVLLRQQTRRRWHPTALARIFDHLPRLQEIHYEPWIGWRYYQGWEWMDEAFPNLFEVLISNNKLRRLTLFQNTITRDELLLSSDAESDSDDDSDPIYISTPKGNWPVARLSLQLEHLSASFIVDASHFFDACESYWEWPRLTSLALTSQLLTPDESPLEIDSMLQTAAKVALRMPNLKSMEIWNARERLAMLFRYQVTGEEQPAVMTWRGTWELTLPPSVIEAWEAVALKHCGHGCIVVGELLDADVVRFHGDAIHHLKFLNPVIRPVSLEQIRMEHRVREGVHS